MNPKDITIGQKLVCNANQKNRFDGERDYLGTGHEFFDGKTIVEVIDSNPDINDSNLIKVRFPDGVTAEVWIKRFSPYVEPAKAEPTSTHSSRGVEGAVYKTLTDDFYPVGTEVVCTEDDGTTVSYFRGPNGETWWMSLSSVTAPISQAPSKDIDTTDMDRDTFEASIFSTGLNAAVVEFADGKAVCLISTEYLDKCQSLLSYEVTGHPVGDEWGGTLPEVLVTRGILRGGCGGRTPLTVCRGVSLTTKTQIESAKKALVGLKEAVEKAEADAKDAAEKAKNQATVFGI